MRLAAKFRRLPRWLAPALLVGTWLGWAAAIPAAEEPTDEPITKIVLYPAAEPVPALKYLLLPPLEERRPGNAAVYYGKVTAEQTAFFQQFHKLWDEDHWWHSAFADFSPEEARRRFDPPLYYLEQAARCESCDWQLPIRTEKFYTILLPEIQYSRTYGRMLALEARIQIAQHDYRRAAEVLQAGYALARNVAEGSFVVGKLVGVAIADVMFGRVLEWTQLPDSPNLYWALTALPQPLVDFRSGYEGERAALALSLPELAHVDRPGMSAEQSLDLVNQLLTMVSDTQVAKPEIEQRLTTMALLLAYYPAARQALIERGRPAKEVDAMPAAQVVLVESYETYQELRDDVVKWLFLPYLEAREGAAHGEERIKQAIRSHRDPLNMAQALVPILSAPKVAEMRGQRQIAFLRVLSALRLYAAQHGRLPEQLRDIHEVPIPLDPARNEPFVYQARDEKNAVLELPGKVGTWDQRTSPRYEIHLENDR